MSESGEPLPKKLQIYSLTTHQIVKTLDFGEGPDYDISALDVNERALVVVSQIISIVKLGQHLKMALQACALTQAGSI